MLKGITIILIFLFIGEAISKLSGLPIPGNIIGMLLITGALRFKLINLEAVQSTADYLIKNMILFFVPPSIAIMLYFDLLKSEWLAVTIGLFVPIFLVLFVVGNLMQRSEK